MAVTIRTEPALSPEQQPCFSRARIGFVPGGNAWLQINYHPHSGWFDEGPSKGPPPCGRGLKPPEVQLFLSLFFFLLVSDVLPNDGLV